MSTLFLDITPTLSFWSVVPPLIAIVLALIFKEVIISLTLGILSGMLIIANRAEENLAQTFLNVPLQVQKSLFDEGHLSVILFTVLIGGMVSVISQNGGMMAIVKKISHRASTAKSGQMATWFLGIAIFFDDYANTLIVGNTMRPITDKLKISREKLAYLVDSTAAPVAAIGFITTWIGSELVYIKDGISKIPNGANLFGSEYSVFISSLQFMFYPILTLIFMFFLIWKGRDFGPMLKAEQNARKIETSGIENAKVGEIDQIPDNKEFVLNGLLPILTLVVTVGLSLYFTGKFALKNADNASLSDIIGNADSYKALVWGSFLGLVSAILLTVSTKVLSIEKTMNYVLEGFKSMIPAIVILALAWTLGSLTEQLGTAEYLAQITEGNILPQLLPTIVFILAGLIAFSTGTSWGTMAILYPMVLFTSWKICIDSGISQDLSLFVFANVVSAVLAGSVLGDHCSPISDTTILSSMASDCNHISHVKTQMPYALTVGAVAILLGTLPAGFGVPFYITFPLCIAALYFIVSYFGKMVDNTSSKTA